MFKRKIMAEFEAWKNSSGRKKNSCGKRSTSDWKNLQCKRICQGKL